MRFLFVSERLSWPRCSGHDVHTYYLMQALIRLGHSVSLATVQEQDPRAIEGAELTSTHHLESSSSAAANEPLPWSKMCEKFRNYWGISTARIRAVGELAHELSADTVVVVGLHVLPYLGAVEGAKRVWYAGDEWVWHHWSQVRWLRPSTWGEIKQVLVKGIYERAYAGMLDRVWMVSTADRKAWRWVTGYHNVDVIPNGIDTEHYQPLKIEPKPYSCVFWGRLDFGPNIQALEWFCSRVWPRLRRECPAAMFQIYGFQPTPQVEALASKHDGISITPNLPDLRRAVQEHAIAVLPFVSGWGIKNKLLEAAAMQMPIICTPRAIHGLHPGNAVIASKSPRAWIRAMRALWDQPQQRAKLGREARSWVEREHTWEAAARSALRGLQDQPEEALCNNSSS